MINDISADIGPLYEKSTKTTIPMYSFDRPAVALWQGVYEGMIEAGCSHKQATDWLQSKEPRWLFDITLEKQMLQMGREIGRSNASIAKAA